MPSYRGPKRSGTHSTLIDDAVAVVRVLQALPEVTKISPGFITSGSSRGAMHIKVLFQKGCLLVRVHGRASVQELRVYCSAQDPVLAALYTNFMRE
jgi:hypothetical protein